MPEMILPGGTPMELTSSVRQSICAVGYVTIPIAQYIKDPGRPFFKVCGTGFVIHDELAMTNAHVLKSLNEAQVENGFPDNQRALMFVYPTAKQSVQVSVATINSVGISMRDDLDVGIVRYQKSNSPEFRKVVPLDIPSNVSISIGDPVAICGYPYGTSMLHRSERVYRWGPVTQRGFVSAISPYENVLKPDELLLDVRIAPGMSGAPIVRTMDAQVIGIVHSSWEATTAVGLPLTKEKVTRWVQAIEKALQGESSHFARSGTI
jgi:V8-like Glu-specific endopeptidase